MIFRNSLSKYLKLIVHKPSRDKLLDTTYWLIPEMFAPSVMR